MNRRHDLDKNIFADKVNSAIITLRPYFTYIAVILVAGLLVFLVALIVDYNRRSVLGVEWGEFIVANQSKNRDRALADLAREYPDSAAGVWASLAKAATDLDSGTREIYDDRIAAESSLGSAIESFETVVEKASDYPDLAQQARFGIGVAHETMGEVEKAIEIYEQVVAKGDETPVANMAQRRVDSLRDPETIAFYDWFRGQTSFDRSGGGANPSFPGMPAGLDFPNPGGASRDPKLPNGLRDLPAFPDTTIPAPFSFPGLDLGGTTDDTERPPNPEIPIESNTETPGTDSP
ncbi:MAG: hypothetical protein VB878_07290 [Pirellulaceae bacterium]